MCLIEEKNNDVFLKIGISSSKICHQQKSQSSHPQHRYCGGEKKTRVMPGGESVFSKHPVLALAVQPSVCVHRLR